MPPSTGSITPVIIAASSLLRNAAAAATSSTVTSRRIGIPAVKRVRNPSSSPVRRAMSRKSSVSAGPGQTPFTLIGTGANSSAG